MSDNIELPLNTKSKPGPKPGARKPSGAQHNASMAHLDNSLGNLSREEVAHGEARSARRRNRSMDMRLYVDPKYTANPDIYYRLVADDSRGRLAKCKSFDYEHVTDENGVNISVPSGNTRMYLMGLHKKFRAEDDKLKLEQHNAMLRGNVHQPLKVDGLEDYTDSTSKESSDKFSS